MYTHIYPMCSMLVHTNEHRMPNILATPVQLAPWAPTASGWSNASAATTVMSDLGDSKLKSGWWLSHPSEKY